MAKTRNQRSGCRRSLWVIRSRYTEPPPAPSARNVAPSTRLVIRVDVHGGPSADSSHFEGGIDLVRCARRPPGSGNRMVRSRRQSGRAGSGASQVQEVLAVGRYRQATHRRRVPVWRSPKLQVSRVVGTAEAISVMYPGLPGSRTSLPGSSVTGGCTSRGST